MNKGKAKGKNDAYKKFSNPLVEVKLFKIKILYNRQYFFFQRNFLMNKLYQTVILSQLHEFE